MQRAEATLWLQRAGLSLRRLLLLQSIGSARCRLQSLQPDSVVGAHHPSWRASLVCQTVKSVCLQRRKPGFVPWVRKIPWRRKWQPTPVLLPGKSHGQRINLPGPGIESASPAMAGRFPPPVPLGQSSSDLLKCTFLYLTGILYSEMYDFTLCFFCLTCRKLLLKIIFKVKYTFNILLSDRLFFVSQKCKE